jgi:hypothetical protein
MPQMFATMITGLQKPARSASALSQSPFAGRANVRLSQVNFRAPGLCFGDKQPITRLSVEVRQEGIETIVDPDDGVHTFQHHPVVILSESDGSTPAAVPTVRQALATDWASQNQNVKSQAPIGPFAAWRVVLREKDLGGVLDWSQVTQAYLEFEGNAVPFRR